MFQKFKIIKLLIILIFFISPAKAEFDVKARTAILQDTLSGEILYEKSADLSIFPASMTKIMTTIVVFDLLKKGDIALEDATDNGGGFLVLNSTSGSSTNAGSMFDLEKGTLNDVLLNSV